MWRFNFRYLFVLLVIMACGMWNPGSARAQDIILINPAPTACIDNIRKSYFPNMAAPTFIFIAKYLTATQMCTATVINAAFCNPNVAANAGSLNASVTTMQIGMNPSCAWNCAGACGNTISTNSSTDGLPVELMDFKVTAVPKAPSPPQELSKTDALVSPRS